MPTTIVCKLGDLRVRGGEITFGAARSLEFDVPAGTDAEIGFHYDYEEGSAGRERTRVAFSLMLGSEPPVKTQLKIGDMPLLPDAQMGFLSGLRKKLRAGEHRGRFVVEADYDASSWMGNKSDKSRVFRHEGSFVLRVK